MAEKKEWLAAGRAGDLPAMQALMAASEVPAELAACREPGSSSSGHTALHWAAAGGHLALATWLLSLEGTDIHAVNHGGSTALHSAAANNQPALVQLLLEQGAAAADVKDANGDEPFAAAALRVHEDAARLLAHTARPHAYLRLSLAAKSVGLLLFELDNAAAPKAVKNFLGFASGSGPMCYRGTIFHRLLPGQALQGGQFKGGHFKGSIFGGPFADERAGLGVRQDRRGLLCMANSGPNSNGSQFYVTLAPCEHLSGSHVVFGRLVAGGAVLDAVGAVPVDDADRPTLPISISDCGRWPPPPPVAASESITEPSISLREVADEASANIGQVLSAVAQGLKRKRDAEGAEAILSAKGTSSCLPALSSKMSRWDAISGLSDDDSDQEGN